jgi:hypothetical protein
VLSETGEGEVFEGWMNHQFSALRFCRNRRKGYATKNPAGALHPDLAGVCYRSAGKSKWKSRFILFPNGEMGKGPLAHPLSWSQT